MRRIFSEYAYGAGPRSGCWWDETCDLPKGAALQGAHRADVAIVGAGFTGLSAALHLAQAGARVAVVEAQAPGWGASGRNGGFCCLGGGMLSDDALDRRVGRAGRLEYRQAEQAAVTLVGDLIDTHRIEADRHSNGETTLAHRPSDMDDLERHAATVTENYGITPTLIAARDLRDQGMAGPFHGALTVPVGFGLNPRKYLSGLLSAATAAGAQIHQHSLVRGLVRVGRHHVVQTDGGTVAADQVVIATNGYSSEDLPDWLAGRYMPGQSNVMVTRPLSEAEVSVAGWSSDQMAYDTRHLLHYFRLMPDRRFLFGMRGGLMTGPSAERRARARIRRDFDAMFPAWAHVDVHHNWSGMVCLARDRLPFVGAVPDAPGLWAGLCYHGNGVAMGTYSGAILADLAQGKTPMRPYPAAMQRPLTRFPLGRARRAIMPLVYAGLTLADR